MLNNIKLQRQRFLVTGWDLNINVLHMSSKLFICGYAINILVSIILILPSCEVDEILFIFVIFYLNIFYSFKIDNLYFFNILNKFNFKEKK